MLDFETLNDALIACVKAAGGSKVVGATIWPDKTVDQAQRHLLNCLSDGRAERLTPEQVLLIAKLAKAKGCHAYAQWVCADVGYQAPVPTEPKDERAELQRKFIEATRELQAMAARIGQLGGA